MSNAIGSSPASGSAGVLRSIARSIQATFPEAADNLRGIADMDWENEARVQHTSASILRHDAQEEIRRSQDTEDQVRRLLAAARALVSALERTENNFQLAVQGKPVRDMAETLAESQAALIVGRQETEAYRPFCSQCGQDYSERACGPTHAVIAHRMSAVLAPRDLLESLVDDEACWFDRHGGCQAHGYLSLGPDEKCPQHELKDILKNKRSGA